MMIKEGKVLQLYLIHDLVLFGRIILKAHLVMEEFSHSISVLSALGGVLISLTPAR